MWLLLFLLSWGVLTKYMVDLLHQLFSVVWHEELVPPQWRVGLIVRRGVRVIQVITGV